MGDIDAGSVVRQLRSTFRRGHTRSLSWRLEQLKAITTLLQEREGEICSALQQDLGRSPFDSFCTEIAYVGNSCKLVKENLKKWMAPHKVRVPLPVQPASSAILAEPLGLVLIFSSWNFPLMLAMDPMIGAIAAGNAVVLKPSEIAPAISTLLAKLIPQYLDISVVQVVEGGVAVSTALLEQRWDKIFYTGSAQVGKIIMTAAAKHLTPVTLELGGKSPTILDTTANFEVAARRIASGKWGLNSGQACIAPDYILADEKAAQKLINVMKKTLRHFYGEDPSESNNLTRIVNKSHFLRLRSILEDPETAKAIVYGGECDEEKLFIQPTILLDPPMDGPVMTDEIFGPILPIITTKTMEEAIDYVNSKPKPLALYLFTNDESVKEKIADETSAGAMVVNDCVVHFHVSMLPFGGIGESGMGVYHGKYSFDTFSHMKPVLHRSIWGDSLARYPPYTQIKQSILKSILTLNYLRFLLIILGFKK